MQNAAVLVMYMVCNVLEHKVVWVIEMHFGTMNVDFDYNFI